jgi:hypothetical protein
MAMPKPQSRVVVKHVRQIEGVIASVGGLLGTAPALVIFLRPWREMGGKLERRELRVEVPLTSEKAVSRAMTTWDDATVSLAVEQVAKASGNRLERNVARSPLRRIKTGLALAGATAELAKPVSVKSKLLGTLKLDRDMSWFEGKRRHGKARYDVMILCRDPDNAKAVAKAIAQAEAAVVGVERALRSIGQSISDALLKTYNDQWRQGGRALTAAAFARKHVLYSLEAAPGRITLLFDCAGLFADHVVEVRLSPRLELTEVCLAG